MTSILYAASFAGFLFFLGYGIHASVGWRIAGYLEGRRLDRLIRQRERRP